MSSSPRLTKKIRMALSVIRHQRTIDITCDEYVPVYFFHDGVPTRFSRVAVLYTIGIHTRSFFFFYNINRWGSGSCCWWSGMAAGVFPRMPPAMPCKVNAIEIVSGNFVRMILCLSSADASTTFARRCTRSSVYYTAGIRIPQTRADRSPYADISLCLESLTRLPVRTEYGHHQRAMHRDTQVAHIRGTS